AHALVIWLRFQRGALPGGGTGLSQQWREEMHRRQAPDDGLYALGWYSGPPADGGVERVSHSGVGAGTGAYQGLFPDRIGVAVLQASATPEAYEVASSLYRASSTGERGTPPSAPGAVRDIVTVGVGAVVVGLCVVGIVRGRRGAEREAVVRGDRASSR